MLYHCGWRSNLIRRIYFACFSMNMRVLQRIFHPAKILKNPFLTLVWSAKYSLLWSPECIGTLGFDWSPLLFGRRIDPIPIRWAEYAHQVLTEACPNQYFWHSGDPASIGGSWAAGARLERGAVGKTATAYSQCGEMIYEQWIFMK